MLIKKVQLNNIRSYTQEVLTFSEGSTLLNGDIGGGKSTILLAIAFALFGADTDALSGEALLRKGANDGSVGLHFDVQGVDVFIHRGLKRSKKAVAQTEGYMLVNGVRKDAMPIELKSDIINLLGYPEELVTKKKNLIFTYTVYCPQEEMKVILSEDKDARLDTLRKIFGIDKYKRVSDNCTLLLREFRMRMREIDAQLNDMPLKFKQLEELRAIHVSFDVRGRQLAPRIATVKQLLADVQQRLQSAEQQITAVREKKRLLDIALAQSRLKNEIAARNSAKIKQLQLVKKIDGDAESLQRMIDVKDKEIQSARLEQKLVQQRLVHVTQKILELDREIAQVPSIADKHVQHEQLVQKLIEKPAAAQQLEAEEKAIERLKSIRREYELRQSQAQEVIDKLKSIATCPLCLQNVPDGHKRDVHQRQLESMSFFSGKLQEVQLSLNDAAIRLEKQQQRVKQFEQFDRQLSALGGELKIIEQQARMTESKKIQLADLRKTFDQLETEQRNFKDVTLDQQQLVQLRQQLDSIKEYTRACTELQELGAQNTLLEKDIALLQQQTALLAQETSSYDSLEDERKKLNREIDGVRVDEKNLAIQYAQLETEKKNTAQRVEQLTIEIKNKELLRLKSQDIARYVNWLDQYFIPLMAIIEKHVLTRIYVEFNDYFKQWFGLLVADDGMAGRLDDSFAPVLEQNGYEIDVAYLSGGERTSAALAYRLALNKVISDVIETIKTKDLLILDEPTEGFSTEQLDRVRDVLLQLQARQVIIVSHEQKIESFVNQTIKIVKENGVSRVVKVY